MKIACPRGRVKNEDCLHVPVVGWRMKIACPRGLVKNEDCLFPWSGEEWRLPVPAVRWRWRLPVPWFRLRMKIAFTLLHFKDSCYATVGYVTSQSNFALYVYIMHNTIGLTRASNHANRVSGVNEYSLCVGHPAGFWITVEASVCPQDAKCTYFYFYYEHNRTPTQYAHKMLVILVAESLTSSLYQCSRGVSGMS